MDYQLLLWKYIGHVGNSEGIDFILTGANTPRTDGPYSIHFTAEEIAELERLAKSEEPPVHA